MIKKYSTITLLRLTTYNFSVALLLFSDILIKSVVYLFTYMKQYKLCISDQAYRSFLSMSEQLENLLKCENRTKSTNGPSKLMLTMISPPSLVSLLLYRVILQGTQANMFVIFCYPHTEDLHFLHGLLTSLSLSDPDCLVNT